MRALPALALLAACGAPQPAPAPPPNAPSYITADETRAIHGPAFSAPVEPFRIVGNLYYVGAANIASYLITTPAGDILIDTGTREMIPIVRTNIEKLGFKVTDIKILLSGHAHFDHVGGHAAMQRASHAQVMALGDDAKAIEAGKDLSPLGAEGWEPVHVDRVLKDGDTVELGGTTLEAVWAPGHTPGCTVWTTSIGDRERPNPKGGEIYKIAFFACAGPNTAVPLVDNPKFPGLADQGIASFEKLKQLHPDIWLLMHPASQLTQAAAIKAGAQPHPLYDPDGWPKLLDESEADLRARFAAQQAKAK